MKLIGWILLKIYTIILEGYLLTLQVGVFFVSEEDKQINVKIYEAEIVDVKGELKKVATDGKTFLYVGLNDQYSIKINSLQIAGKKRLKTEDLLRGFKINNQWFIK